MTEPTKKSGEATDEPVAFGRWISVTDRLPDEDAWVLTLQTNGEMVVNARSFDDQWCCDEHGFIPTVTHWMPLPDKPAI